MKKKKSKIYFGEETEKSIEKYILCQNDEERIVIYLTKIKPAFDKLVENIINMTRFDFKKIDNYKSLHNEVSSHLYSNLLKFNPKRISVKTNKKTKAFSYFGTAAKNYLIQLSIKKNSEMISVLPIETEQGVKEIQGDDIVEKDEMREFLSSLSSFFEKKLDKYDEDTRKIVDAIIYFLNNVDSINVVNKKHFYILIKEYTGLSSKKVSKILNFLKKEYQVVKNKYYSGEI